MCVYMKVYTYIYASVYMVPLYVTQYTVHTNVYCICVYMVRTCILYIPDCEIHTYTCSWWSIYVYIYMVHTSTLVVKETPQKTFSLLISYQMSLYRQKSTHILDILSYACYR